MLHGGRLVPMLVRTETHVAEATQTLEHAQSVYRGDRYRITTKIHFDHTSG